ncbi:glycerophosphodiester phosphodiesterase family protein [uncultured Shimia sp.]|uniref:glycerophosphodiester phosphodiesterase family protein n=1 Tax=uncultured Shimia sp. TaxID=573152 RepID=UPI0025CF34D5|nr:glycerophosphodiester phosphodiesterase family protein [uncultured Shimia sp.]
MTQFPQLNGFRGAPGLVRLIGHRGARGVMPENTLEGFAFTVKSGVVALEFDVVLTQDQVPVVTHNHHLLNAATRGVDGKWLEGEELKVSELPLSQLQSYDVGGLDGRTVYGQRFPDQVFMSGIRVPTLGDLLDMALTPQGAEMLFLLEMKSDPQFAGDSHVAETLVSEAVNAVRARGLEHRTVLHSFDWNLLEACGRIAPDMPRSFLTKLPENARELGEDSSKSVAPDFSSLGMPVPQAVAEAGGQMWCPFYADVTAEAVAHAHELGLLVSTWTVNEVDEMHRVIDAGVDGIVTDYPGRAQRVLLERGLVWSEDVAQMVAE